MKHILFVLLILTAAGCAGHELQMQTAPEAKNDIMQDLANSAPGDLRCRMKSGVTVSLGGLRMPDSDNRDRALTRNFFSQLSRSNRQVVYIVDGRVGSKEYVSIYHNDLFINAEIVRRGYARAVRTTGSDKYDELFAELEEEAKSKKRGIWAFEADW